MAEDKQNPDGRGLDPEVLRQALADVEDTKHRLQQRNSQELERLRGDVLAELIPVLDNLERVLEAARDSGDIEALLQGIEMVQLDCLKKLEPFGLTRTCTVGDRFDPRLHDAVAVVPVDDPAKDGVVLAEHAPAYLYGERVVRPARVEVGRSAARPPS